MEKGSKKELSDREESEEGGETSAALSAAGLQKMIEQVM